MKQFFDFSTFFQHAFGSQLRRNVSSGIIRAVGNFGIIALSYPLYLYYLGYESYGVWLILATVLTFAQMGNLGISSAITKLVAEEYGRSDTKGMQSYVTVALAVLSTSGLLIFLVILFFKSQIIDLFGLSAENRAIGLWLLPYIGALSVYIFFPYLLYP